MVIALGIDTQGRKHVLGLREGATETAAVTTGLLSDLVTRGLPTDRTLLFVIDGAQGLRRAITDVFGSRGVVQRCQVHKWRNVIGHLPERLHASVGKALRDAWNLDSADRAARVLKRLAGSLEHDHPGAAASIREGLDETLTVQRVYGVGLGALSHRLRKTPRLQGIGSRQRQARLQERLLEGAVPRSGGLVHDRANRLVDPRDQRVESRRVIGESRGLAGGSHVSVEMRLRNVNACRVGGGAPRGRWPPSAAQTVRAVFPHTAFTKTFSRDEDRWRNQRVDPPPARRVQPVGKSPRSLMLGSFTHGTVHLSALAHLTVLSGPDRLRRPPSPTHSVAAP